MNAFQGNDDVNGVLSVERLRQAMAAMARRAEATPACLDEGTIARLADGTLDAGARAAALPHLAACAACRTSVASVARALADPDVAREVAAVRGVLRRRVYRILVPLAAAAALAVILAT